MSVTTTITGPAQRAGAPFIWTAKVEIVERSSEREIRNLFVSGQPVDIGARSVHLPGTALMRVNVKSVRVEFPQPITWTWKTGAPCVTLLVQSQPEHAHPVPDAEWRCVGGEIALSQGKPAVSGPEGANAWKRFLPNVADAADLRATGSGLSLEGRLLLPWMRRAEIPADARARFDLMVAPQMELGIWLLTLDRDSLTARSRPVWIKNFEKLNELWKGSRWTELSLPKNRIPEFHYLLNPAQDPPQAQFVFPCGAACLTVCAQPEAGDDTLLLAPRIEFEAQTSAPTGEAFEIHLDSVRPVHQRFGARLRNLPDEDQPPAELRAYLLIEKSSCTWKNLETTTKATLKDLSAYIAKVKQAELKSALKLLLAAIKARLADSAARAVISAEPVEVEDKWVIEEKLVAENLTTIYDPFEAAEVLRARENLMPPDLDANPTSANHGNIRVSPAILWGSVPTARGWVQLPFLNVTEETYLRSIDLPNEEPTFISTLIQGAATFGNETPGLWGADPAENRWSLILRDADRVTGDWAFSRSGDNWQAGKLTLEFQNPELVFNGLLSVAVKPPSALDFLPDFDFWLKPLHRLSLRTPLDDDRFLSPLVVDLARIELVRSAFRLEFMFDAAEVVPTEELSSLDVTAGKLVWTGLAIGKGVIDRLQAWTNDATLGVTFKEAVERLLARLTKLNGRPYTPIKLADYACQYRASELLKKFGESEPYRGVDALSDKPLVWQRHPQLPAIQSLPLTQVQRPASHPSPNRQLAPFEFADGSVFRFAGTAASWWNTVDIALVPSREWSGDGAGTSHLPMASLSLPGLACHAADGPTPAAPLDDPFLPWQYHFGLPYLDEPHALAALPPEPLRGGGALGPAPIDPLLPPVELVLPQRSDYRDYWSVLAEKGFLAAADADGALEKSPTGATPFDVVGLVEPYRWPVNAEVDGSHYPGAITFDQAGTKLTIGWDQPVGQPLRGIDGVFEAAPNGPLQLAAHGRFTIVAGSLQAKEDHGERRDQRGLTTGPTSRIQVENASDLSETSVSFKSAQDQAERKFRQTSLYANVELPLRGLADDPWQLWFSALPVADETSQFLRSQCGSPFREGVNDPWAQGRELNFRNGYEWRLSGKKRKLGPFDFFPLTLEEVHFDAGAVTHVELTGRLQLPLPGAADRAQAGISNAVRLVFDAPAAAPPAPRKLELVDIRIEAPDPIAANTPAELVWPLSAAEGAPRLVIGQTSFDQGLKLEDVRIEFGLFGLGWSVQAAPPPTIIGTTEVLDLTWENAHVAVDDDVFVKSAGAHLNLKSNDSHQLVATIVGRWGNPDSARVEATIDWDLLQSDQPRVNSQLLRIAGAEIELDSATPRDPRVRDSVLQISWDKLDFGAAGGIRELLPGFVIDPQHSPGFAVMTFAAQPAAREGLPPKLTATSGFLEGVFACKWPAAAAAGQDVFGSSAGTIDAGWTYSLAGSDWSLELLLNGLLTVRSLISWPDFDPEALMAVPPKVVLPAALPVAKNPLTHYRHSATALLNDVKLTGEHLEKGSRSIFTLREKAEAALAFLAVVEHSLQRIVLNARNRPSDTMPAIVEQNDQRQWTAVQEVRFVRPRVFQEFLKGFSSDKLLAPNWKNRENFESLKAVFGSYLHESFLDQACDAGAFEQLETESGALLVEMTSVVGLRPLYQPPKAAKQTNGAVAKAPLLPSTVRQIPSATLVAVPATQADYAQGSADAWRPLVIPFIGRLQTAAADGLDTKETTPLRIDPILVLHRQRLLDRPQLDELSLNLASRTASSNANRTLGRFDAPDQQALVRLDPATMWELWFRIQVPPLATADRESPARAGSILASSPQDAVAGASRADDLQRLFDPTRLALPPQSAPLVAASFDPLLWREGALAVVDIQLPASSKKHAFYGTGAQLLLALPAGEGGDASQSNCVTLLPPPMSRRPTPELLHPVSFAVCPYRSIDRLDPPAIGGAPKVVFTDVLVQEQQGASLMVLRDRVWQPAEDPDKPGVSVPIEPNLIRVWASDLWSRLAGDSVIGVLRVRELYFESAPAPLAAARPGRVRMSVRFELLSSDGQPQDADIRPLPVRGELGQLRFPETGFHDAAPPLNVVSAALNPPRIRAVTPQYVVRNPAAEISAGEQRPDLSFAALTLDIDATRDRIGASGALLAPEAWSAWWQSISLCLQFANSPLGMRQTLPRNFRSRAIRSLAPALPDVQVPRDIALPSADNSTPFEALKWWQPVLPGSLRWSALGDRAGAFFAGRARIITSESSTAAPLYSGSVPVQHRFPRPAPIPRNVFQRQAWALAPWGEWFDLDDLNLAERSAAASFQPADDAFVMTSRGAAGLRAELTNPWNADRGAVPFELWRSGERNRLGALQFTIRYTPLGVPVQWDKEVSLNCGSFQVPCDQVSSANDEVTYQVNFSGQQQLFDHWLASRSHGDEFVLDLQVTLPESKTAFTNNANSTAINVPEHALVVNDRASFRSSVGQLPDGIVAGEFYFVRSIAGSDITVSSKIDGDPIILTSAGSGTVEWRPFLVAGFALSLRLASRLAFANELPYPIRPVALRFEDPAYSRGLQSRTKQIQAEVSRDVPGGPAQKGTLTISVDRERINPDSSLYLVYKVEGFHPAGTETPAQFAQFLDSLEAKVRLSRVRDGVSLPGREITGYEPVISPLRHYQLGTIAFPVALKQGQTLLPLSVEPADVVEIGFELAGAGLTLPLMSAFELPVVAEPINPPTPRALALLRKSASGVVDCPRFAWSPKAARIELVNPDDLFQPIVRRRGVFRWMDTIRVGESVEYAVQAITPSGATLIPQMFSAPR